MTLGPELVMSLFLLFCRVAGCVMVMPGFSSQLIPMRIRLLVAFSLTAVLSPLLIETVYNTVKGMDVWLYFSVMLMETFIGGLLGFIGRLLYTALEFAAVVMSHLVGLGGLLGSPVESLEPVPSLTSLIVISATVLLFVLDLHWLVISALLDTYSLVPVGQLLPTDFGLGMISDALFQVSLTSAKLAGPFIAYAVVINLAVGITNKLTPQVPVFLISIPFVLAGGLLLVYFSIGNFMTAFLTAFQDGLLNL